MDFRQTTPTNNARPAVVNPTPSTPEHKEPKAPSTSRSALGKWMLVIYGVLLVGIAVLALSIAFGVTRNPSSNEGQFIDSKKYQAVFLNNGQVYFGNIDNLTNDYVRLINIYYLTQSGDSTSSNYSLVKLGCQQIHDPTDLMVINRSQVSFWENLDDKGKVVTSINEFKRQNPNGPDCTKVSNQTQAAGSSTQNSQNSTTGTGTGSNSTTK